MKFKVWDDHSRRWLDEKDYCIDCNGELYVFMGDYSLATGDHIIPVFSVETCDKNGEELFDGDIYRDSWGIPRVVTKKYKAFRKNVGYGKIEKIGNKFENPELLDTQSIEQEADAYFDSQPCKTKKIENSQDDLLFSQREKLGKEIEKWMSEHGVANTPASTLAFLAEIGLLNVGSCKQYLRSCENKKVAKYKGLKVE